jgi:hypothetical protein
MKAPAPPVPTFGDLARAIEWVRVVCNACHHERPMRYAPLIERFGADTSSDVLRNKARCTRCGQKGAMLIAPSWVDSQRGFAPFPGDV